MKILSILFGLMILSLGIQAETDCERKLRITKTDHETIIYNAEFVLKEYLFKANDLIGKNQLSTAKPLLDKGIELLPVHIKSLRKLEIQALNDGGECPLERPWLFLEMGRAKKNRAALEDDLDAAKELRDIWY